MLLNIVIEMLSLWMLLWNDEALVDMRKERLKRGKAHLSRALNVTSSMNDRFAFHIMYPMRGRCICICFLHKKLPIPPPFLLQEGVREGPSEATSRRRKTGSLCESLLRHICIVTM